MSNYCMRGDDGYVECFTDGSCFNNGYAGAQAGIGVYFGDYHPWNVSEALNPTFRRTNNTAEIRAAIEAIYTALENDEYNLVIYSDSYFMIQGITNWKYMWRQNGWITSNGKPVINKRDFLDLENAQREMEDVCFEWVPRNSCHGIRQADMLAKNGASFDY